MNAGKFETQAAERRRIRKEIMKASDKMDEMAQYISDNIDDMSCNEIEDIMSEMGRLGYKIEVLEADLKNIRLKKISIH